MASSEELLAATIAEDNALERLEASIATAEVVIEAARALVDAYESHPVVAVDHSQLVALSAAIRTHDGETV